MKNPTDPNLLNGSVLYIIFIILYYILTVYYIVLKDHHLKNNYNNIVNLKTFIKIKEYKICLSINYK